MFFVSEKGGEEGRGCAENRRVMRRSGLSSRFLSKKMKPCDTDYEVLYSSVVFPFFSKKGFSKLKLHVFLFFFVEMLGGVRCRNMNNW